MCVKFNTHRDTFFVCRLAVSHFADMLLCIYDMSGRLATVRGWVCFYKFRRLCHTRLNERRNRASRVWMSGWRRWIWKTYKWFSLVVSHQVLIVVTHANGMWSIIQGESRKNRVSLNVYFLFSLFSSIYDDRAKMFYWTGDDEENRWTCRVHTHTLTRSRTRAHTY